MKEVAAIFLFVAIVAVIGLFQQTSDIEEYNFPTANAILHRCITHQECGALGWCQDVTGRNGGIDGRRGKRCVARYPLGISCFDNLHCRSGYCNDQTQRCDNRNKN